MVYLPLKCLAAGEWLALTPAPCQVGQGRVHSVGRVIKKRADSMLISTREFNLPHQDTCHTSHRQSPCYQTFMPEMLP